MEFLFRDRGSGKRQVKPSQEIALLEDQLAGGESSDDEDFTLPEKGKNSVENSLCLIESLFWNLLSLSI